MGILDLYGFESAASERNGFEQLVINFANEKLQQVRRCHRLKIEFNFLKKFSAHFSQKNKDLARMLQVT